MRPCVVTLVLVMLGSCATADILRLDTTNRTPVPVESVTVLPEEPDKPYEVIGLIEVSDESWGLSMIWPRR